MASKKQKVASRANGARSRVESLPRFRTLMTSLQEELKPETAIENLAIHKMAVAHCHLTRVWGMERSGLSNEVNAAGSPKSPDAPTCDALAFGKSGVHLNEYTSAKGAVPRRQITKELFSAAART
jgi:hypothetical protein